MPDTKDHILYSSIFINSRNKIIATESRLVVSRAGWRKGIDCNGTQRGCGKGAIMIVMVVTIGSIC